MLVQLEDELSACREEAVLTDQQLEVTRQVVNVLQKQLDVCQQQSHETP